ncbi:MAG: hypothetical protein WA137_11070, partial [Methanothrix sp.]
MNLKYPSIAEARRGGRTSHAKQGYRLTLGFSVLDLLSRRSSFSFISVPQRYPPKPVFATTRWQGTRMAKGFAAMARPT